MRAPAAPSLDGLAHQITRSYQRRGLMLITGTYLFIAVFVARMLTERADETIGLLFAIPIALFALALGLRAGIGSALLALVLLIVYDVTHGDDISLFGYLSRATVFLLLGALIGATTTQLNVILDQLDPTGRRREL